MESEDIYKAINDICDIRESPLSRDDAFNDTFLFNVFQLLLFREFSTSWSFNTEEIRLLTYLFFKNHQPQHCDSKIKSFHQQVSNSASQIMKNKETVQQLQMYIIESFDNIKP